MRTRQRERHLNKRRQAGLEMLEGRVMLSVSATSVIAATSYTAASGVINAGSTMGSLDAGDWLEYAGVDFGAGVGQFQAQLGSDPFYSGGVIELHTDSKDGPVIGQLNITSTGGWSTLAPETAVLSKPVTGVHDLYLVFAAGTNTRQGTGLANLSSIQFAAPAATSQRAATAFSAQSGGMLAAPLEGNSATGTTMCHIDNGSWLEFAAIDFGSGVRAFEAALGTPAAYAGGQITVHVDSLSGPVVASLTITATAGWELVAPQVSVMGSSPTGIHDVYLAFSTGANQQFGTGLCALDWIRFLPTGGATRTATATVQAESYDAKSASIIPFAIPGGNQILNAINRGAVLEYDAVDFGAGVTSFSASMGSPASYAGGEIHLYADSTNGTPLGTLSIANTGAWGTLVAQTTALSTGISGVHDLFLVFDTGTNAQGGYGLGTLDSFQFS